MENVLKWTTCFDVIVLRSSQENSVKNPMILACLILVLLGLFAKLLIGILMSVIVKLDGLVNDASMVSHDLFNFFSHKVKYIK